MQENRLRLSFVQTGLPWVVAAAALLFYAVTLNHWVSLESLPYVAKIAGWDWALPYETPLFFLVTYPFRWLPTAWQPLGLNLFSVVCGALTLALLARSIALLPHDRTHEQRQRERSEFSLLSIPAAWVPPVLAVLVCGLELTFWENSTAASNEVLDLLLFAYVIRCLLEFRISQEDSWLMRMSLVCGLGMANNYAMIGFFPCVLTAVLWTKGLRFFEFRFCLRMLAFGLLGLSLYLVLPLAWAVSDVASVNFWQALHAHLASQKAMLLDSPQLRTRVLVLSLTSILPILIIAIRWPTSFGDTSATGAALSSVMFRVVHTVFLAACIWVAFDQQFSPRVLGKGAVAFLTFYYLGALSIGYFCGYLLLVFGEVRSRSWHRRSGLEALLGRVVFAAVAVALVAVPTGLAAKNWKSIRMTNGPLLRQLAELSARHLPPNGAMVLSDDAYGLLLLSAGLSMDGVLDNYVLIHTRSLLGPDYHQELHKRYPTRWPNIFTNQPPDERIDDASLLFLISTLGRTNQIYYLHPSFGYYFEPFYMQPHGLVEELKLFPTNSVFAPDLSSAAIQENESFWSKLEAPLKILAASEKLDSRDARYASSYYSRALNSWGVALQRGRQLELAGKYFQLASDLNTNNVPAQSNLEFNRAKLTGQPRVPETPKSIEEKFVVYRGWETMLLENGMFDQPDFCARLGQIFGQQGLFRQSAIQWDRVRTLDSTNFLATLALAEVYLDGTLPAKSIEEVAALRSNPSAGPLPAEVELEMDRIEATAHFDLGHRDEAEKILRAAFAKYPKYPGVLDTLVRIYAQTGQIKEAFDTAEEIIKADPDRADSYINLAKLHRSQGHPDQAIASIDRFLQKVPNQPDALLYKIFVLTETKDYARAKSEIDRLLNVQPENVDALLDKGAVEIGTKAYAAAVESFERVLKHQPNGAAAAVALRNRAFAFLQLGELAKAEKDYNAMRRMSSRSYVYVAYWGLGEVAYRRNDAATAKKYYDLYLLHAPSQASPELNEEKRLVTDRLKTLKEARR